MNKFFAAFITVVCFAPVAQSQIDPFGSSNFDTAAYIDSSVTMPEENNSPSVEAAPTIKPYVRIKMPYDTVTELLTYMGVVPFKPFTYPDNSTIESGDIDSLYVRARKYLLKKYGKAPNAKDPKDNIFDKTVLVKESKPDGDVGSIIITPTIPMLIYPTKYYTTEQGTLTFRIEIRVKEDKYKYKVTNFVHHTIDKYGKPVDTYMEYYYNSKNNPRGYDTYLISIDRLVKQMVKDLGKVMPDPIVKDEDDF